MKTKRKEIPEKIGRFEIKDGKVKFVEDPGGDYHFFIINGMKGYAKRCKLFEIGHDPYEKETK